MAPTGFDSPPEPQRIGQNTFYYYGTGGGGVSYPDGYYFNLHGKILAIDFDGPYENDKTPTPETNQMEQKVLASFREFWASGYRRRNIASLNDLITTPTMLTGDLGARPSSCRVR
jgi:hypothetical protein